MKDQLQGCGKDDEALTLYRLAHGFAPLPVSDGYWHVRCGYRPPARAARGILLCRDCSAKHGLRTLSPAEPSGA